MGVDNAISGGNNRRDRIAKFLAKPPSQAVLLTLHTVSSTPVPLGEWTREEWTVNLADTIDAAIEDTHEELSVADSAYMAAFLNAEGRAVLSKRFSARSRPGHLMDTDDARELAKQFDGSERASGVLVQQTGLALGRMFMQGSITVQQSLTAANKLLHEELHAERTRNKELRADIEEAEEEIAKLKQELKDAQGADMHPAFAKLMEAAGPALPAILAGLMQQFQAAAGEKKG